MNQTSRDLTHTTLLLLFIGLLIGGSFWILKPFLLALIWAIMIVVATWPLLLGAQSMVRRPSLARGNGHDRRRDDDSRSRRSPLPSSPSSITRWISLLDQSRWCPSPKLRLLIGSRVCP